MADLRSASVGALSVLGLTLLGAAVGCGRSNPASAMRPDAPTARAGLGESACSTTPLVVDLPSPQRVAVEAELSKGRMMLAHYECSADGGKLTLMRECTHFVGYKYAALTRREEIVRMNDADAVRAQLPLTGDGLAANLSGELSRGSTLDLALVNVGRYVAPSKATYVDEVPKGCERATHAISAISTGAFAMSIGTRAHARAVAEIFSAGASAESRSELVRATRDGSLDACDTSEAGKPPPEQCRAPLRMESGRSIRERQHARSAKTTSMTVRASSGNRAPLTTRTRHRHARAGCSRSSGAARGEHAHATARECTPFVPMMRRSTSRRSSA